MPVDLVVLHSISLPAGQYGGHAVRDLFTGRFDADAHPDFEALRGLRVSAHFFVRRDGELQQFVSCAKRAWHAGVSRWDGRERCNDFSIGIELEGLEDHVFETAQYEALDRLLKAIAARWPVRAVQGHEHVAPGRKRDPGRGFDWVKAARSLPACRWPLAASVPLARLPGADS